MNYPGGKNGFGAYQKIICQMPPHDVYLEPFLGSGAVMRAKRPAPENIGIDIDPGVVAAFDCPSVPGLVVKNCCGISFLKNYHLRVQWTRKHLIYLDPPYLKSSRLQNRPVYRYELTDDDHFELLQTLLDISSWGVKILISGYETKLYNSVLGHWRRITWTAMTRGGSPATECLWMNFPEPVDLHDYQFLGENKTERQRIKRKIERWQRKLEGMPILERQALLAALDRRRSQS